MLTTFSNKLFYFKQGRSVDDESRKRNWSQILSGSFEQKNNITLSDLVSLYSGTIPFLSQRSSEGTTIGNETT